jgi:hypothetical protein
LYERETILLFNEEETTAIVETCNQNLKTRLAALTDRGAALVKKDKYAVKYTIPKKWIKINPGPNLSADERRVLSDAAKARFRKNPKGTA